MDIALYEIIVVDNNSTDDSVEIIKRDFPVVVILNNEQNLGAPRGRNVGSRRAFQKPVDYILTLDNDLFIEKSCLKELLQFSEQGLTIGTIGAFIYDAANPQHLLSAGGVVDYTQNISRQLLKYSSQEHLIDVDYCGTGAMLTRRRIFNELLGYIWRLRTA